MCLKVNGLIITIKEFQLAHTCFSRPAIGISCKGTETINKQLWGRTKHSRLTTLITSTPPACACYFWRAPVHETTRRIALTQTAPDVTRRSIILDWCHSVGIESQ
ncbi:hypothetical protein J6590_048673 [Homalodisca vitripennis]|nr:hypothetical protein J6590_048673 [Homalodisca vitripennis]